MKGLIITSLILAVLIVAGIGTSIIVHTGLTNRSAAAHERGFEKGYAQGYKVGLQEGSEVGYQEGSKVGYEKGNRGDYDSSDGAGFYFLYNPTYDEVHKILAEGEMVSAKEILGYAEANGIRVAYVRCRIGSQATEGKVYIHQLVAFETVDNGLIIIEPWSHQKVRIEVGQSYSKLNSFPDSPYDDTITEITIIW